MGTILLIIVILLLVGALPAWPYSSGSGDRPSGGSRLDSLDRCNSRFNGTSVNRARFREKTLLLDPSSAHGATRLAVSSFAIDGRRHKLICVE